ncbi:MAG: hypothetical protein ACM3SS_25170 [Rhodospirillaceae bacterium]
MKVRIIVPEEQAPAPAASTTRRTAQSGALRLGVLDNSKANADHLLRFIAEGLRAAQPLAEVVNLRKPSASRPAEEAVLAKLAAESDFVISAMAD